MRLGEVPEKSPVEKDLGILMHEKPDMIQQCVQRANLTLGCIPNSMDSRLSEVALIFSSALLRTQLDCRVQLWGPQHKEDVNLSE